MTSIASHISFLPFRFIYWQVDLASASDCKSRNPFDDKPWNLAKWQRIKFDYRRKRLDRGKSSWIFTIRASGEALDSGGHGVKDLLYRKGLDSEKRISSLGPIVDALSPPMLFVYRLASAILTAEDKSVHQKRKSRAYQWKRPTVFLEEGGSLPPDFDPDTTRWIPANHPLATTASDIDEDFGSD